MDSDFLRKHRGKIIVAVVFVVLYILIFPAPSSDMGGTTVLSETVFYDFIEEGRHIKAELSIRDDGNELKGTIGQGQKAFKFETVLDPDGGRYYLVDEIADLTVRKKGRNFFGLILMLLPIIFMLGLFMMMRKASGAGGIQDVMKFGKNKKFKHEREMPRLTFEDVAGMPEAKEDMEEFVEFLRNPDEFLAFGAEIPKGMLLIGPPGCGKTLIAKAVAGEAGVHFLSIAASEFVEMFVGVGASRVRDLFEQARIHAPCIIFIDEIDAVGGHRGVGIGGGHDEREQTLNQILSEMDGFEPTSGIIVMAATNRPDILDEALTRTGRFDREVHIDKPNREGRRDILRVHARGKERLLAPDVSWEDIAKETPGLSGSDLKNIINEGALAARREFKEKHREALEEAEREGVRLNDPKKFKRAITMAHLRIGVERAMIGKPQKSRKLIEAERRLVACHETGHALLGEVHPHTDPPTHVTCVPHGSRGGTTMAVPEEEKYLFTKEELKGMLVVALGGQAAEQVVFSTITTGASDDIEKATEIALAMVTKYGMSKKIGPIHVNTGHDQQSRGRGVGGGRQLSQPMQSLVDDEVRSLVVDALGMAEEILRHNPDALKDGTELLLDEETLYREQLKEVFADAKLPPGMFKQA